MQDYVKDFQDKIAAIDADAQRINIINAGVMNHGKSSLFNSLLDKNVFPEEDIRTTVKIQAEQWHDNIYLIDTPGLSAEIVDDAVAYEAYRRANVIIFVHRVDTGELHKNGIDGLNKIKALFPDEKFFAKHLCLVLTSIDEQNASKNLSTIIGKVRADIQNYCGLNGFKIFSVSNPRYRKGMAENKTNLVAKSGIPELREYLQQNFQKWLDENQSVRAARISREKEDFIAKLNRERGEVQSRIQSKTEQIKRRQQNFLHKLEEAVSLYNSDKSEYEYQDSVLDDLNNEFVSLMERWKSERY
jgi:GTPase Era involved in 16S rRNA processing